MLAKVKDSYRWNALTAFAGVEFTKSEWRNVPAAAEDQAKVHEWLEVKDGNIPEPVEDENVLPLPRTDFPRSGMPDITAPIPDDLKGIRVEEQSNDPRDFPKGGAPDVQPEGTGKGMTDRERRAAERAAERAERKAAKAEAKK